MFGFDGIASEPAWITKMRLGVFVILFVVSLIMGRKELLSGI